MTKQVNVDNLEQVQALLREPKNWGEAFIAVSVDGQRSETTLVAGICPLCCAHVTPDDYSINLHSQVHEAVASKLQELGVNPVGWRP